MPRQLPTPRNHSLYALLTDPAITSGIVVSFACGLRYEVGSGWFMTDGFKISRPEAYSILRQWQAERRYRPIEDRTDA